MEIMYSLVFIFAIQHPDPDLPMRFSLPPQEKRRIFETVSPEHCPVKEVASNTGKCAIGFTMCVNFVVIATSLTAMDMPLIRINKTL